MAEEPGLWRPALWPSWLAVGVLFVVGRIPAPLLAGLGDVLGMCLYVAIPKRRKVALQNVSACFPELSASAHRRLVWRHFRALGRSLFDTGIFWWASPARLRRLVRIRGGADYDRLRMDGRPIILMVPHFLAAQAGLALALEAPVAN
ncbi:MAG TPA: hypothetical protein VFN52_06915, partial [Acidiferrobacteraceae bacterium]|nr:hypothetical protein [Acidiferrobacteraceae bacterium]